MSKKIVVHLENIYGFRMCKEFEDAESYLEWRRETLFLFDKSRETRLTLLKVTSKWLPIDWSDFI